MAPTIVLKHNKPFLALGSPGGATIITTVLQILFDRLDEGWTLPQAIADPRASQRNATTTGDEPAFQLDRAAHAAGGARTSVLERGRDRRGDGIEFLTAASCSRRPSRFAVAPEARWW